MPGRRGVRDTEDTRARDEEYDEDAGPRERDDDRTTTSSGGRERRGGRSSRELVASEAAEAGLRHMSELTSKPPVGVTSVEPVEDGWVIEVEVVEDRRIPSSADVLAIYELDLDLDGTLMSYRRTKRYSRGRGDSGGQ
jgi:hypothetical protein